MEREQALQIVKPQLTEHRYQHTLGVMETAIKLAGKYGADTKCLQMQCLQTLARNFLNFKIKINKNSSSNSVVWEESIFFSYL